MPSYVMNAWVRARSGPLRAGMEITTAVVLFGTIALSTTTGLGLASSWYDEQRILCSIALCLAALGPLLGGARIENRAGALLFLVVTLGLVSALHASRPGAALCEWATYALVMYWIASMRFESPRARARVAALFAAVIAVAYGGCVIANYVSALLVHMPLGDDTFLVGFANARFPAQLEALTLPFLYVAFTEAPSRRWAIAARCAGAIWWMCLFGSGSRTAWIALFLAGLVLLFVGGSSRRLVRWHVTMAMVGLALYAVLFDWAPSWFGLATNIDTGHVFDRTSLEARFGLMRLALSLAAAHPWLGVGPMHFAAADNGLAAHPHNFWLQLAAEWGVLVAVVVLALCLVLAVRLVRRLRRSADDAAPVDCAALAALIVWIIGTQADGYMVASTSQVASALVLMFAWRAAGVDAQPMRASAGARLLPALWHGVAVVALVVFATLPWSPFGAPTARESAWREQHPNTLLWPRFWQQGWIGPDQDPTAGH